MRYVWAGARWVTASVFALLALSSALTRNWLPAASLAVLFALVAPPIDRLRGTRLGLVVRPLIRLPLVVLLIVAFGLALARRPASIYRSEAVRQRVLRLYDEKMRGWPVLFEDLSVETSRGHVHVVASGAADAPPVLLLHASGVGSWSWKYNAGRLSETYRVFAVDLIGDVGKSALRSMDHRLRTKADQADLYAEIVDSLGIESAFVVGASEGGFVATNLALRRPERVRKLALLAPMGYAGAVGAIVRIVVTQLFPLRPLQDATFAWAFSRNPALLAEFGEWFRLLMTGVVPAKVAPLPFTAEERRRVAVPVLFLFGARDHLVGSPSAARALVQDIPDVRVKVLDAGHLIAAERPAETDSILLAFFRE